MGYCGGGRPTSRSGRKRKRDIAPVRWTSLRRFRGVFMNRSCNRRMRNMGIISWQLSSMPIRTNNTTSTGIGRKRLEAGDRHFPCGGREWFLDIERSRGKVAALTFKDGLGYCAFGDASGYLADRVQLWDYSQKDTSCWAGRLGGLKYSRWPIGWVNSQASEEDIAKNPTHIGPIGMCFVRKP